MYATQKEDVTTVHSHYIPSHNLNCLICLLQRKYQLTRAVGKPASLCVCVKGSESKKSVPVTTAQEDLLKLIPQSCHQAKT